VPFFLLTSLITLSYFFVLYLDIDFYFINAEKLKIFSHLLQSFTSLIAVLTIAYFFAIRFKVSQIIASILAITVYITLFLFDTGTMPNSSIDTTYGFDTNILLLPILSTYLLKIFYPIFSLQIKHDDGNYHIYSLFNYIFVFLAAYFVTLVIDISIDYIIYNFIINFNPLENNLPDIITLAIRNLMVEVLWFFGIHGEHVINGIFGKEILFKQLFENLTYGEFNRIFVLLGGAGIGLGLLVSLLILAKEKSIKTIVKISIPFSIFNINTLLIYAVVVLNRFLIIPFLFLPLANLIIAYTVLHLFHIDFTQYYVTWITPVFIDSYLKTEGNLLVVFLQLSLLIIDIFVYTYFVKKFLKSQSSHQHVQSLEKNLNIGIELKSESNIESFKAQKDIIQANINVEEIISNLNQNTIFVYYQPKINIKHNTCNTFEALIRYKQNGKLVGPIFLDTIEKAGLSHIIDLWVSIRVKEDLEKWKKQNFFPNISINIHPDTLKSHAAMRKITDILEHEDITFEIIERSFLFQSAENNLTLIQDKGFGFAIDDFGIGYSSFKTLVKHNITELKIDKSLIDIIDTNKGYLVSKHISSLCKDLNCLIVAEGVETKEQLDLIKKMDIDLVQGYYFSKAIHFDEVLNFKNQYESSI